MTTDHLSKTAPSRSDCWVCDGEGWDWGFNSPCSNCATTPASPAQLAPSDEPRHPAEPDASVSHTHNTGDNDMPNFWDDEEVQAAVTSGQFHKLTNVGDVVEGDIAKLDKRKFDEGTSKERTAIEITFADESILTAGQVKLMDTLVQLRPGVGDHIRIELADIEKRGSKTLKSFKVTHTNADGETFTVDQTA